MPGAVPAAVQFLSFWVEIKIYAAESTGASSELLANVKVARFSDDRLQLGFMRIIVQFTRAAYEDLHLCTKTR